ncbi:MAG: hypothetical protein IJI57_01705 [Flexilinea sp.]|nr:hypothetical protein [Flexilinea sp.]
MPDPELIFSDRMFYDENVYRPEVTQDGDGFYRWRYTLDKVHDRRMYRFLIIFWAIFAVCGAVLGFLLAKVPPEMIRQDPSRYQTLLMQRRLLYAVLGYAVFFAGGLIITGLVRLIEGGPSTYWYRMNDDFVQIKPSGRGSGINSFADVKRAELYPDENEIRLISRWGKCPLLVRAEDYDLVKDHILVHLPKNAEFTTAVSKQPITENR